MKKKILSVVLFFGLAITVTTFAQNGGRKIEKNIVCPQKPTVVLSGAADLQGKQRGLYSFRIASGSLQRVKNYVDQGCRIGVLLSDEGFLVSDLHACNSVHSRSSNFRCHFGQTQQIIQRPDDDNTMDAILADTYIEISQTSDVEFSLRSAGRVSDGSHEARFNPVSWYGEESTGIVNIYVSR